MRLAAATTTTTLVACGAARAATVNGTVAPGEYATVLATQTTPTGFGDNFSELNQALANYTPAGNLELALTGNLEPIGNGFILFIDSKPGGGIATTVAGAFNQFGSIPGQRTDDWGTDINPAAGVTPTPGGASVLSPGFNPDYALEIHNTGGASYFINVIDLTLPNAPANNRDVALGSAPLNSGAAVTHTYTRFDAGGNPIDSGDVTSSFDNRNAAGVTDTDASGAATATRGLELILESQFLAATPGHALRVLPFITSADGATLSNQFLPGLGAGVDNLGPANDPAGTPLFDARSLPDRFYLDIFTPTLATSGDWFAGAAWTGGAAPNGAEHAARVAGSGAQTVTFAAPVTLGSLELANSAGATLGGGGTLNFNAGNSAAALLVGAGSHNVNAVVNVHSDWRVNVAQDASVTVSGLSVAANKRVIKVGDGTLALVGSQMLNGAGVTLDVQRGTLAAGADLGTGLTAATAPQLTVGRAGGGSPAVVDFASSQTLKNLTVHDDGTVNVLPDRTRVLVADTIALAANAKIDLADNKLVTTHTPIGTATTPSGNGRLYDGLQGMVQKAKNGDAWDGNGLTSSKVATEGGLTTIGIANGAQAKGGIGATETAVWGGQTITGSSLLAMYTYAGDANLDGAITGDDYSAIDFGILFEGMDGYANGDFNYDGYVTGDDYSVIDLNILLQGPQIPTIGTSARPASVSAVPEPAACLVATVLAAATLRRRRRRHRA